MAYNLVTTIIIVVKSVVFDTFTYYGTNLCNMLSLGAIVCKTKYFMLYFHCLLIITFINLLLIFELIIYNTSVKTFNIKQIIPTN